MRGYEMKLNVAQSFIIFQQTTNLVFKFDEINQMSEWNRKSSSNNFNSCYAKIESTARLIDERSSFNFESFSVDDEILPLPHIKFSLSALKWFNWNFCNRLKIQKLHSHQRISNTRGISIKILNFSSSFYFQKSLQVSHRSPPASSLLLQPLLFHAGPMHIYMRKHKMFPSHILLLIFIHFTGEFVRRLFLFLS